MEWLSRRLHQLSLWPTRPEGHPPDSKEIATMAQYRVVNPLATVDAAYIAGLIDGEGTITLSRKHAAEKRQLAISISNTEERLLDFVLQSVGAGKITRKRTAKAHHSPSLT
jgi:hypothetical protein